MMLEMIALSECKKVVKELKEKNKKLLEENRKLKSQIPTTPMDLRK